MITTKEFIIEKNDAGQRLDKFVLKAVPKMPKALLYKYLRKKRIKIDNRKAEPSEMLVLGQAVQLYINDEFFEDSAASNSFLSITPNINIAYEDENIIVVDKASGVICHADEKEQFNTLINHILAYLYEKGEYIPEKENSFTPALCNRIDRNTSGLVIAAKNAECHRILCQKIKDREIKKRYLCVTVGSPPHKTGTFSNYLVKNPDQNRVYVHEHPVEGAKHAVTHYKVKTKDENLSLVEAELVTGRTHQIRAQFAAAASPLLGDGKYGNNAINNLYGQKKQILQSYRIDFAFETDAGELGYLKNKVVQTRKKIKLSDFNPV